MSNYSFVTNQCRKMNVCMLWQQLDGKNDFTGLFTVFSNHVEIIFYYWLVVTG